MLWLVFLSSTVPGEKISLCFERLGVVPLQHELKMSTDSIMIIFYLEYSVAYSVMLCSHIHALVFQ